MRSQHTSSLMTTRVLVHFKEVLAIMSLLNEQELISIGEELINYGRSGDSTDQLATQLAARICELYKDAE